MYFINFYISDWLDKFVNIKLSLAIDLFDK